MPEKKETRKYVFTVEGETEQWYLYWLRDQINATPKSKYNVSLTAEVEQHPLSYAKKVNPYATPSITHLCDVESKEKQYIDKFNNTLKQLKAAKSSIGIQYDLGYSNLTFELWMVLHKQSCLGSLTNRSQYLSLINRAFNESFDSLKEYKKETNFRRCLSRLSLIDVKAAVNRSKQIMNLNADNELQLIKYNGFKYYLDNPSLTIYEAIEHILEENELL